MEQKSIKLNAILNVMKTVFSLVFPLITFPYVTRMLQVEAMGKYDFSGSIISYFTLLAALGINIYAVREGAKYRNDKEKIDQFASEIFSINVYSTIASYILLFICLIFIQKLHGYTVIILIFSLQLLLATMSVTWIYNIFEDFGYITMVTLAMQLIALILMFLLVHNSNDLYKYVAISVVATNGSGFFMYFHAKKYVNLRFIKKPPLKHLKPILIVFSTSLASTIYVSSDTTILGWVADDYRVGIYGTAAKIYKIVKQMLNAIIAVVIPRFAYYIGLQKKEQIIQLGQKLIDYMIAICLPAMVGLYCMSKPIVKVCAGESFGQAYLSLQLLSVALIFAVFANFFANCVLISYKKEKTVMFATILSAVVNIVLNLIFVPMYLENAAAATTIIAEICVCGIATYESTKLIKISCTARNLITSVIGCICIVICCHFVQLYIQNQILVLCVGIIGSAGIYGIVLLVLKNTIAWEVVNRFIKRK